MFKNLFPTRNDFALDYRMNKDDSQRNDGLTQSAQSLVPASPSTPLAHPVSGVPEDSHYDVPHFEPVPVQHRHDGWTPVRQRAFIEALAATACVEDAARSVGMSPKSAHRLRARADAVAFRDAWDVALDFAVGALQAAIFSRAVHGEPVPHYYKGELIGEHRRYNDQLAMFVMRHYGLDGEEGPRRRSKRFFQRLAWLTPDDPNCDDPQHEEADAG